MRTITLALAIVLSTAPATTAEEPLHEQVNRAIDGGVAWLKKNYKGWTSVRVLPPEQIKMQSFNFTDERIFELIPDFVFVRVVPF